MKRRRPVPTGPATPEERRAFASFLIPIYEQQWHSELTSPKPCWMFLAILHRRLLELEQECR